MPDLSVIIASHNAAAVIGQSLAALVEQPGHERTEIIVADSSSDETPAIVRTFSHVRLLHYDEPLTVPELRGRAIAACRGRVIAILDPFSLAADDWIAQVVQAHQASSAPIIGGAVELYAPERQGLVGWALYINEYGMFMPPVAEGRTDILPGCNVSYKRSVLFDGTRPRHDVFWKTFVNWKVQSSGTPLQLAPAIVVTLRKPVPFADFLRSRFDHGRCFAAMRSAASAPAVRAARGILAPLVPALLLCRWTRAYWMKRRYRGKLIATLPLQVLLFALWGAGEGWGYLRGGGRSCRRLFY